MSAPLCDVNDTVLVRILELEGWFSDGVAGSSGVGRSEWLADHGFEHSGSFGVSEQFRDLSE